MKKIKIAVKVILWLPLIILFLTFSILANFCFRISNFLGEVVYEDIKNALVNTIFEKYFKQIKDDLDENI